MLGDDGGEVTPVPIPNTEVKLSSADGSWRDTACESRTLPGKISNGGLAQLGEHLPYKQGVGGSIPSSSTIDKKLVLSYHLFLIIAGWSSQVARRAHNPKVAGSNPAPATKMVP